MDPTQGLQTIPLTLCASVMVPTCNRYAICISLQKNQINELPINKSSFCKQQRANDETTQNAQKPTTPKNIKKNKPQDARQHFLLSESHCQGATAREWASDAKISAKISETHTSSDAPAKARMLESIPKDRKSAKQIWHISSLRNISAPTATLNQSTPYFLLAGAGTAPLNFAILVEFCLVNDEKKHVVRWMMHLVSKGGSGGWGG